MNNSPRPDWRHAAAERTIRLIRRIRPIAFPIVHSAIEDQVFTEALDRSHSDCRQRRVVKVPAGAHLGPLGQGIERSRNSTEESVGRIEVLFGDVEGLVDDVLPGPGSYENVTGHATHARPNVPALGV